MSSTSLEKLKCILKGKNPSSALLKWVAATGGDIDQLLLDQNLAQLLMNHIHKHSEKDVKALQIYFEVVQGILKNRFVVHFT